MQSDNKLLPIEGEKIRRQYFNIVLYFGTLCVVPFTLITYLMNTLLGKEGEILQSFTDVIYVFIGFLILMIPFFLLSVLNRFLFGQVVCVLEKEGLHHSEGFIIWDAIVKIEYELNIPSKDKKYFCYAHIIKQGIFDAEIIHAPYYLLKEAKNYHPDIEIGLGKRSKFLIGFFTIVLVLFIVAYNFML